VSSSRPRDPSRKPRISPVGKTLLHELLRSAPFSYLSFRPLRSGLSPCLPPHPGDSSPPSPLCERAAPARVSLAAVLPPVTISRASPPYLDSTRLSPRTSGGQCSSSLRADRKVRRFFLRWRSSLEAPPLGSLPPRRTVSLGPDRVRFY